MVGTAVRVAENNDLNLLMLHIRLVGSNLPDNTVPIIPIHHTWSTGSSHCSRLQLPLKLAWAMTMHKGLDLNLDQVGKKEFCAGLTYVACSHDFYCTFSL